MGHMHVDKECVQLASQGYKTNTCTQVTSYKPYIVVYMISIFMELSQGIQVITCYNVAHYCDSEQHISQTHVYTIFATIQGLYDVACVHVLVLYPCEASYIHSLSTCMCPIPILSPFFLYHPYIPLDYAMRTSMQFSCSPHFVIPIHFILM